MLRQGKSVMDSRVRHRQGMSIRGIYQDAPGYRTTSCGGICARLKRRGTNDGRRGGQNSARSKLMLANDYGRQRRAEDPRHCAVDRAEGAAAIRAAASRYVDHLLAQRRAQTNSRSILREILLKARRHLPISSGFSKVSYGVHKSCELRESEPRQIIDCHSTLRAGM